MNGRRLILAAMILAAAVVNFRSSAGSAQENGNGTAPAQKALPDSWIDKIQWRSVGPANMSGRITAIAVYEKDPCIWYVASASGGLIKTINNGVDFEHQFDHEATVSIGDVQVFQGDPNIVWVGTGEANPRNSASWGNGVYRSTDGGKTWKHLGLDGSFQIGRIALHPENPDVAYVGALGRLWGPNEERGLFKTTDGGKTWEKILYVDDNTGVIDVQLNPKNADTLLVATYERQRDGFDGNDPITKYGEGAGIYRSTDGGATFEKLTQGLPTCKMGRIGLQYFRKNPDYVYAIIETEKIAQQPANRGNPGLRAEDAEVGAKITNVDNDGAAEKAGLKVDDIVISVNGGIVHSASELMEAFRRHKHGDTLKLVVSRNRESVQADITLAEMPQRGAARGGRGGGGGPGGGGRGGRGGGGGNEFSGTLGGQAENLQGQQGGEDEHEYGGIYESKDGGTTWTRINTLNPRPMYYSQLRVDPSDRKYMYVLGTSLYRSKDGGSEFTGDGGNNVHPDHHAMWIDPRDGRHMILGNDGGVYVTWDRMDNWDHYNHVAIGQFYHVGVDTRWDYNVYGGLQDNGSWGGPSRSQDGSGPVNTDWFRVGGGDGFITHVDPEDPHQIYFESQGGAMGRINLETGERGFIRPRPPSGTRYRFNWKTPFILSPHNSKVHYSAGNYVFRSPYKGDKIKAISPEITNTGEGTGSALSESPVEEGVIYVGTTDGAVWVTKDGGNEWTPIFVRKQEGQPAAEEQPESESEGESASDEPAEGRAQTSQEGRPRGPGRRGGGGRGARPAPRAETSASETPTETATETATETRPPTSDPVSGSWTGKFASDRIPEDRAGFSMNLKFDGALVSGSFQSPRREVEFSDGKFNAESGELTIVAETDQGTFNITATIKENQMNGQMSINDRFTVEFSATRGGDSLVSATSFIDVAPHGPSAMVDDVVTGKWTGTLLSDQLPEEFRQFTLELKVAENGEVSGRVGSAQGDADIVEGQYNADRKKLTMYFENENFGADLVADVSGTTMKGYIEVNGGEFSIDFDANRTGDLDATEAEKTEMKEQQEKPQEEKPQEEKPQQETPPEQAAKPEAEQAQKPAAEQAAAEQAAAEQAAEQPPAQSSANDPITGTWTGQFDARGPREFTLNLKLGEDNKITGDYDAQFGGGSVSEGNYDPETNKVHLVIGSDQFEIDVDATLTANTLRGTMSFGGRFEGPFEARKQASEQEGIAAGDTKPLEELLPGPRWVSSLEASKFQAGRCYITLDGHRSNDDEPYVLVTENFGKSWRSLRSNLPTSAGSTRVVREDIANENILYLGCEFSAWVSIDRGLTWTRFQGGLPTVAVHEFAQHPKTGEIVAGTHGRSIWIADVTPLRQMTAELVSKPVHLYTPRQVMRAGSGPGRGSSETREFTGQNPGNGAKIYYSLGQNAQSATLTITDVKGSTIQQVDVEPTVGLHEFVWDLRRQRRGQPEQQAGGRGGRGGRGGGFGGGPTVPNGTYLVTLEVDGNFFRDAVTVANNPDSPPGVTSEDEIRLLEFLYGDIDWDEPEPLPQR